MKSLVALIRREYLEHRGAFLFAPGAILVILAFILFGSVLSNRYEVAYKLGMLSARKLFEFGLFGVSALWGVYLLVALFFYYADAFNADRRNNNMLFWKSMPVSDFQVLTSKMLAGMTVLPGLIFSAVLVTSVLIFATTIIAASKMPQLSMPGLLDFASSTGQIGLFLLVALALGLLWYAPFFAWVGLLSTLFGRWSIPLAFLIPGLVGLAENLILSDPGAPRGGYVLAYLRQRFHFGPDETDVTPVLLSNAPFDAATMISRLVTGIDWTQLVGGLIVAALLVYAASEYRRRMLLT